MTIAFRYCVMNPRRHSRSHSLSIARAVVPAVFAVRALPPFAETIILTSDSVTFCSGPSVCPLAHPRHVGDHLAAFAVRVDKHFRGARSGREPPALAASGSRSSDISLRRVHDIGATHTRAAFILLRPRRGFGERCDLVLSRREDVREIARRDGRHAGTGPVSSAERSGRPARTEEVGGNLP